MPGCFVKRCRVDNAWGICYAQRTMKIFFRLLIFCVFTMLTTVCPAGEAMSLVKQVTQLDAAREQAAENDADAAYEASCYYLNQGKGKQSQALKYALKAAELGSAEGAMNAGVCYYEGIGTERDYTQAAKWFEAALKMGCRRVLNALAYMHWEGTGVQPDEQKALSYAEQALDEGIPRADLLMLSLHEAGISGPKHLEKVQSHIRSRLAANPEDAAAYMALAVLYEHQEVEDNGLIRAAVRKAAELGNAEAMYNLAMGHLKGYWGMSLNEAEAIRWMQAAAALEYEKALLRMAAAHYHGNGVEKDWAKVIEYTQRAIKAGEPLAYIAMGELYRKGEGVEQNYARAAGYFRLGIEKGANHAPVYAQLAVCMLEQDKSEATRREACRVLRIGAGLNDQDALRILGIAYEEGWAYEGDIKVPADAEKAQRLFDAADAAEQSE